MRNIGFTTQLPLYYTALRLPVLYIPGVFSDGRDRRNSGRLVKSSDLHALNRAQA